ncbi:Leucine Rich Repeat [Seminavis robusta]|uniref:Leucine Rich Repeat n=1 Tax=Seminavis robusta TaxID=568900 RepID=A0A9N8HKT1_9STRA|nr:Leucine Rich Repeat [Seminavis robusta]|eukprot:Sro862_g212500.1 Leucine Rich Repeat (770) ;mRNA; r:35652-38120
MDTAVAEDKKDITIAFEGNGATACDTKDIMVGVSENTATARTGESDVVSEKKTDVEKLGNSTTTTMDEGAAQTEPHSRQAIHNVAESTDDLDAPGSVTGTFMPPITTAPQRQSVITLPGAYSAAPGMELQRANTLSRLVVSSMQANHETADVEQNDPAETARETAPVMEHNNGLAVANPVEEALPHHLLPQAHSVDGEQQAERNGLSKKIKTFLLLGLILQFAVIMILVAFLAPEKNKDMAEPTSIGVEFMETESPTPSPTSAPTILADTWDLLPRSTLSALEDPYSAQARAYDWVLTDPNRTSYPQWKILQRFALVVFYYSTGGEAWNLQEDWLSYNVDECSWYFRNLVGGATNFFFHEGLLTEVGSESQFQDSVCNADGQYMHLVFTENNMVGTLPPELSLLSDSLQYLEAGSNENLYGLIPSEIGLLTNLRTFSSDRNHHSGQIPTEIGQLSNLLHLELGRNPFTGSIPSELGNLEVINHLSLRYCPGMSGTLPTELYRLTNMVTLRAEGLEGLSGGKLLSEIGQMTKLDCINLHHIPLNTSIPTEIGLLSNLRRFNVWACQITGSLPSEFLKLTNMRRIDIDDNAITGTIATEFGLFKNLTMAWMNGSRFTGTLPGSIFESWGQVTFLKINNNNLEGSLPSQLGLLTSLELLWLFQNRFSGSIPSELGLLSNVTELFLHDNNLTGGVPESLTSMAALDHLTLSNTSLSGSIPEALCEKVWDMSYICNVYFGIISICYDVEKMNFACSSTDLCGCDACGECNSTRS